MVEPDSLAPVTREAWFSASLTISEPCRGEEEDVPVEAEQAKTSARGLTFPISAGMFMELVANPIPKIIAAGFPTKRATCSSSLLWMSSRPECVCVCVHVCACACVCKVWADTATS